VGEQWQHNMCLIELNVETRKIKQLVKIISFYFCSKQPWPTKLAFYDAGLMCPQLMCPWPKVLGCCTPWTKRPLDIMPLTDVSQPWTASGMDRTTHSTNLNYPSITSVTPHKTPHKRYSESIKQSEFRDGMVWSWAQYPKDTLSKGCNIQEFSVGDTSVGDGQTLHPFYTISSFLSNCTKQSYLHQSYKHIWKLIANIREEKNRAIVFREIINTLEIKPISPSGVFCLGVYYTRDNIYNKVQWFWIFFTFL
jgi:hypothetical protein